MAAGVVGFIMVTVWAPAHIGTVTWNGMATDHEHDP
jgi:hypothetical protein